MGFKEYGCVIHIKNYILSINGEFLLDENFFNLGKISSNIHTTRVSSHFQEELIHPFDHVDVVPFDYAATINHRKIWHFSIQPFMFDYLSNHSTVLFESQPLHYINHIQFLQYIQTNT
jgi:hypothetical protein